MNHVPLNPLLECKGLTRRFGGLVALNSLDLNVMPSEILGLIGPNGSGKTTFFNVVTGIYAPSEGQVLFAGEDLSRASAQEIYRAGIARTFQRSRMCLELSAFDNIMLGNHKHLNHGFGFNIFRRRAFRREYEQMYEQVRELVAVFDSSLVDRIDTPISSFTMIERRRLEVCRALVSQPRLLLLDEPSAGMTHEETRQLMDDLLSVRANISGLSVVIIEHEMGVIERITDRCAVLNFGQKICEGGYRHVASDALVREAYLGGE